ncbi:CoA transferase [Streptodolium elevatio]
MLPGERPQRAGRRILAGHHIHHRQADLGPGPRLGHRVVPPAGPRAARPHRHVAPYGPMPTADGSLVVGATSDRQFAALCASVGVPDLPADPGFAGNAARPAHRDKLTGLARRRLSYRSLPRRGAPALLGGHTEEILAALRPRDRGSVRRRRGHR